jgi:hypothetical protein
MPAHTKRTAKSIASRGSAAAEPATLPPAARKTPAAAKTAAAAQRAELRAMLTDLGRQVSDLSAGADRLLKRIA